MLYPIIGPCPSRRAVVAGTSDGMILSILGELSELVIYYIGYHIITWCDDGADIYPPYIMD